MIFKSGSHCYPFCKNKRKRLSRKDKIMTIKGKLFKNKLGLLELSTYLNNVSEACLVMGYRRDTFYREKIACKECGLEALKEKTGRGQITRIVLQRMLKRQLWRSTCNIPFWCRSERAAHYTSLSHRLALAVCGYVTTLESSPKSSRP